MAAPLILEDVHVQFAFYDAQHRSAKRWLANVLRAERKGGGAANKENVAALAGVDLVVESGSKVAILGGNSVGKTTLLRVMAGLITPQRGRVQFFGRVLPILSLGVGTDPSATLEENILFHGLLNGFGFEESRVRTELALKEFGLQDRRDQSLLGLSSGQHLRLGVALACVYGADLVLLDEVLENGDPDFVESVPQLFDHYLPKGWSLVMIERSRALVEKFCRQAVVMADGRVAEKGSLSLMLARYGAQYTF